MLRHESARTTIFQSPTRESSGAVARAARSMPLLVRSMRVCPSVVDLRCVVLVAWSGERPARTLWFAPPAGGTEGLTRFSRTAHTLPSSLPYGSSGRLGGVGGGETGVLLWVRGPRSRQEAREQADGCVPDRDARPLARACPRGVWRASLRGGVAMRRRRDPPPRSVREPVSQGGTA